MFGGSGGQDPFKQMDDMFQQMNQNMNAQFQQGINNMNQFGQQGQAGMQQLPNQSSASGQGPRNPGDPIVEEPEDPTTGNPSRQVQSQDAFGGNFMNQGLGNNLGGNVQSYSSSSFQSSGGPGGPQSYKTTHQSNQTPGQYQSHSTHQDDVSGQSKMNITRGLGDKGTSVTKTRDAEGNIVTNQDLSNLTEDQIKDFEQQWKQSNPNQLPGGYQQDAPQIQGQGKAKEDSGPKIEEIQ